MRIGIAGLGKMGSAIAARLAETADDARADIAVWNRTRARADTTGLLVMDSPRALAERSDVVITMLFDAAALQDVFHGPNGLLAAAPDRLFIEMSTVRPSTQQALAAAVRDRGGAYVECPVGGSVGPARAGKLLGLMGGQPADAARARPILERLCRRIEHVGPVGAGTSLKLAVNLPLLVFWQSFGEAMAMVRHLDLDPAWLVDLFADTTGGPAVLKARGPAIAAALAGGDPGPATFDIDAIRKDLATMVAEAADRGFAIPVASEALAAFNGASRDGWGPRDCVWLPALWAAHGQPPPS